VEVSGGELASHFDVVNRIGGVQRAAQAHPKEEANPQRGCEHERHG
jgi:hypothetical protein